MKKSLRRQFRKAELDAKHSEDLRIGTPEERHAAAVLLGRRGAKAGGIEVRRLGGLERVRLARAKGGNKGTAAQLAARRLNARKAGLARIAKAQATKLWEQTAPTDYRPIQTDLLFPALNPTKEE